MLDFLGKLNKNMAIMLDFTVGSFGALLGRFRGSIGPVAAPKNPSQASQGRVDRLDSDAVSWEYSDTTIGQRS